ncbi:uncharacterized protein METZ01_LOCUS76340 [marine metagenome]|uniref:FlgD/Vpr Ig-like domain-containing protein n=1 Tax=marine metagenome TaxID=408172 RepID=A0A381U5J7_9ZZZZ
MKKLFSVLLLIQITLAEDINIWISNVQQNSVSVSMVANTEVVGFQFGIDVSEFEGDLFAPVDSIFYNDSGESVTSTVIQPLSGIVIDADFTCFINTSGLLVSFSLANSPIASTDSVVLVELPWLPSDVNIEDVSIVDPLFIGLDENGAPITLEVEYGLIEYQEGWPYYTNTQVISSPAIADMDMDGSPEILFGEYNGRFHILESDGSDICWLDTGNQIWGSPAVADIDNDGILEVMITSKNQHMYILDGNCNVELNFNAEQFLMGTPTLGNLDNDEELEIVFGGYSNPGKLFALNHDGSPVENFPVVLDEKIQRGVALADFNGNGKMDIVLGTDDEHIYLIYDNGQVADGFPFTAENDFRSAPVVVEVMGEKIIFAGNRDNNLYAVNPDGSLRFTVVTGDDISTSPGVVETEEGPAIFFGSEDGKLYGVNSAGLPLSGWPIDVGSEIIGSPAFTDLDNDGTPEIISAVSGMDLLIFRMDGSPYADIPIEFEMPFSGSPAVQDLDNDGDLEIVIGSTNSLIAVDIKDLGNSNNYWNMYRGNVHRTGYFGSTSGSGTISVDYIPDWNLVGLPMSVEDPYHLSVYPDALEGTLYSFDGNYVQENDFITGTGYWLRFPDGGTAIISGSTIYSLIISMMNDWNLISGISSSVPATSIQDPEGILLPGTLFEFDGSYIQAETLEPGKGYWIRSAGPGEIIISDDIRAKRLPFISKMDGANTISFDDQTLYFGVTVPDNEKLSYSVPPKPPSGVFDARFQGDWIYCEDSGKIELTGQAEPLSISFNIANKTTWVLINIESDEEYDLSGSGELIIAEVLNEFILQKNSVLPHSYALHQNFPNPFNPVTSLRYDLPEQSFVTLTIYDLIGREITQLVNTTQEAGFRSVEWDATDSFGKPVSAGIYLYKITTGEFVQTKKMVLVK